MVLWGWFVESNGASWHLWNGGFGLGNKYVRPYIYGLWKETSPYLK